MSEGLYVRTWGEAHHPPVLFLHGFMGSSADWNAVADALADTFFCIGVDLPGHGRSLDVAPETCTMRGTADAVVRTLDTLQLPQCALVGYSMGGRLALYLALHHPERFTRLVLESASPGLETPEARAERRALDEKRAHQLETLDLGVFLREWYRQPLFASLDWHPGLREQMIEACLGNDAAGLARSLRGIGTGRQPSLWERLRGLRVSTCAVAGALDTKYVDLARRMAARAERMDVRIVPDTGHNVHAEQPQVFISFLTYWLQT